MIEKNLELQFSGGDMKALGITINNTNNNIDNNGSKCNK